MQALQRVASLEKDQAYLKDPDIVKAIGHYTGPSGSELVNDYLRGGQHASWMNEQDKAQAQRHVALLDKAFAQATPMPAPVKTYRGVGLPHEFANSLRPGQVVKMPGHSSTSLRRDYAEKWVPKDKFVGGLGMVKAKGSPTLMHITVPAGHKALPIHTSALNGQVREAAEVLVQHNTPMRVDHIEYEGGVRHLHVTLQPHTAQS